MTRWERYRHTAALLGANLLLTCMLLTGIAAAQDPVADGPMTFAARGTGGNGPGTYWVAAEGRITASTPNDFARFLATAPDGRVVRLHSQGGDLQAGIRLGLMLREAGYATSVGRTVPDDLFYAEAPGRCDSACAYAFLGGTARSAAAGELGFHQFFRDSDARAALERGRPAGSEFADAQTIAGLIALYLHQVDANPEILHVASSAGPTGMVRPDTATLRRLRIVTAFDFEFSGWTIEPWGNAAFLFGRRTHSLEELSHTLMLYCRAAEPGTVFLVRTGGPHFTRGENGPRMSPVTSGVEFYIGRRLVRRERAFDGRTHSLDVTFNREGKPVFTFRMSRQEFERGLAEGMGVSLGTSGSNGMEIPLEPPLAGLRERAALMFRLCL